MLLVKLVHAHLCEKSIKDLLIFLLEEEAALVCMLVKFEEEGLLISQEVSVHGQSDSQHCYLMRGCN